MDQTALLVSSLKKCLRAKGITYKDVANALDLSEASIKRNFSECTFTLKRIEEIANLADVDLYELARLTAIHKEQRTRVLTLAQERKLAKDPFLFTYFYLLLNGWTHRQLMKKLDISEARSIKQLTSLDKLGLIVLQPGNKARLLTAQTISWREDGPIRKLYEASVREEFLQSKFDKSNETLLFKTAELSEVSIITLQKKIDALVKEMEALAEVDFTLPEKEKISVGLLAGFRPWVFSVIQKKRRK